MPTVRLLLQIIMRPFVNRLFLSAIWLLSTACTPVSTKTLPPPLVRIYTQTPALVLTVSPTTLVTPIVIVTSEVPENFSQEVKVDRLDMISVMSYTVHLITSNQPDLITPLIGAEGVDIFRERWGSSVMFPGYKNDTETVDALKNALGNVQPDCLGYVVALNAGPDKMAIYFTSSTFEWSENNNHPNTRPMLSLQLFKFEMGWDLVSIAYLPESVLPPEGELMSCP